MIHEDVLKLLDLKPDASAEEIKEAVVRIKADLQNKIDNAGTDTLKDSFQLVFEKISAAECDLIHSAQNSTRSSPDKIKVAAIAAVVLIAIGIFVLLSHDQEDSPENLPAVVEVVPAPVQTVPAKDGRAERLQTEIAGLMERLKNVRQQMETNRTKFQQKSQSLSVELQTATDNVLEINQAFMEAEMHTGYWLAVETLADKVVYKSTPYTQLHVPLSKADQLILDKNIQAAVDILTTVKASLITMLTQAENTEAVVTKGNAVREARTNWLTIASQQSWDQLPPTLKVERDYQQTFHSESEGDFTSALIGYSVLLKEYGALIHAGETLIAVQVPLENAKSGWETLANEYGLNEIPLAITLAKSYAQYQKTISIGNLLAASEKAISLEKGYSDLLAGVQNITQYRDQALKAKQDWDTYAVKQKITVVPQHQQWAENMASAEADLKTGKLPEAGAAYKRLAEDYTALLEHAILAIAMLERAFTAQQAWDHFASINKLRISRATAAEAELKTNFSAMRLGQFEQAYNSLTVVVTAYEELLESAEQALLALRETSIAKNDCATLEKTLNRHFCSKANTDYEVTVAIYKQGEFVTAKTQLDDLYAEYQRLFITNGQSRVSVAGLDITLQTIPAGSLKMTASDDKKAEREINLATFRLMAKEVTFAQYDAYAKAIGVKLPNDEGWGRGDRPVINVNWKDAIGFARWLSRKSGKKFRLPTEAEWEYAATSSRKTMYSWGNAINCEDARFNAGIVSGCSYKDGTQQKGTVPVGSFRHNPWGIYDMSGNVWEWTQDCVNEKYHNVPENVRFWKGACNKRIVRGGSWSSLPELLRSTSYDWSNADIRTDVDGFRLVQEL